MGIASSLFFSNDSNRQTLWRRVRPTDKQFEAQKERWNDLRDYLIAVLSDHTGLTVSSWLQGSYKFGTQIRPVSKDLEFDIDLGIYFQWPGSPSSGAYSALELREITQDALIAYMDDVEEVEEVCDPSKKRCSRIRFKGDFHIDIPVYHLDPAADQRSLALDNGQWEASDPKAIYLWFKNNFGDYARSKVRRQIQYLKNWSIRTTGESGPSSILITVLAATCYHQIASEDSEADDSAFHALVGLVANRLRDNHVVQNPINTDENLNRMGLDDNNNFIDKLDELEDIAYRALYAATRTESAEIWSEAFGHFFPVSDEAVGEGVGPQAAGRDIVLVQYTPEIYVEARPDNSDRTFTGRNEIGPIPKNCDIVFRIVNHIDPPPGAKISWTVRNEGEEAENLNDLGHPAGDGRQASERSAYKGRHYMDATVWLNGRLIGRRRVPVIVLGYSMPSRVVRRPSYTALRRKRR